MLRPYPPTWFGCIPWGNTALLYIGHQYLPLILIILVTRSSGQSHSVPSIDSLLSCTTQHALHRAQVMESDKSIFSEKVQQVLDTFTEGNTEGGGLQTPFLCLSYRTSISTFLYLFHYLCTSYRLTFQA